LSRRLVLLFDGTWNRRENSTNVWRMRLLLEQSADQLVYYDEGVGTEKLELIRGGALGTGLSAKVLDGYLWLMENYRGGLENVSGLPDEVFIFGFSRGAFTARSLVGLLSLCGLMHKDAPISVLTAFETSRRKGVSRKTPYLRRFRRRYSVDVTVTFLGVWDTVGALGIHKLDIPLFERYQYHKVSEVDIVAHVRHALALDEHRKVFAPTLFPAPQQGQTLEQRWFTGSHANVGGGYEEDGLFLRPLVWMVEEASAFGLKFRLPPISLRKAFYRSRIIDSLAEAAHGLYRATQLFKPYARQLMLDDPTMQTVDYTVMQRWLWRPDYHPLPLKSLLGIKLPRSRMLRLPIAEICALVPKNFHLYKTDGFRGLTQDERSRYGDK
jgi:uncharacterized protein (DUF2235 family)